MNGGVEYHLPRFPRPIIGASYLMHDHSPLLCGGENDERDILKTCYYLPDSISASTSYWIWHRFTSLMTIPRKEFDMVILNSSLIWAAGANIIHKDAFYRVGSMGT